MSEVACLCVIIFYLQVVNNGTDLLTTVFLSNISSVANITARKSAISAYEMIVKNSADGSVPFMVKVSGNVSTSPRILVTLDSNKSCSHLMLSSIMATSPPTQTHNLTPSQTASPVTSCPALSCSCSIPTTITVTVTSSVSSSCPAPIVPSPPGVTPTNSLMPSSSTPYQATSLCPTPSPMACPSPQGDSGTRYTKSSVLGLSFGMLFLGVFFTLASLFLGVIVYNHCILRNTDRDRHGYHKHIDSKKPSKAYFQ